MFVYSKSSELDLHFVILRLIQLCDSNLLSELQLATEPPAFEAQLLVALNMHATACDVTSMAEIATSPQATCSFTLLKFKSIFNMCTNFQNSYRV